MKKVSKRKGSKEENLLIDVLKRSIPNLSHTSNSGAFHGNKDAGTFRYLVEIKSTEKKSYSVKKQLLDTISQKAWDMNKKPILAILLESKELHEDNSFVVLPMDFALEVLETYELKQNRKRDASDK